MIQGLTRLKKSEHVAHGIPVLVDPADQVNMLGKFPGIDQGHVDYHGSGSRVEVEVHAVGHLIDFCR